MGLYEVSYDDKWRAAGSNLFLLSRVCNYMGWQGLNYNAISQVILIKC